MDIEVTSEVVDHMRADAARADPDECCGLLLGRDGRIETAVSARNVADRPDTRFEIDPQALIDAHRRARRGGPQIVGYYHSHPRSPSRPSATDATMAAHDGRVWAIVGQDGSGWWCDAPDGFRPVSTSQVTGKS